MASGKKKVVRRIKADTADVAQPKRATTGEPKTSVGAKAKPTTRAVAGPSNDDKVRAAIAAKKAAKAEVQKAKSNSKVAAAKAARKALAEKKEPFILFKPFVAFGRYVRNSWRELRLVQWPSRRATWKMTLGVIIFCIFVGVFVLICDWAFQWLIEEVVL